MACPLCAHKNCLRGLASETQDGGCHGERKARSLCAHKNGLKTTPGCHHAACACVCGYYSHALWAPSAALLQV